MQEIDGNRPFSRKNRRLAAPRRLENGAEGNCLKFPAVLKPRDGYKWRAKMIFVRPGRKRGADTMSRPCEKVVSRTLKSVPQSQNYTLSQCYAQVWSLCIIQRLQVLGWCTMSPIRLHHRLQEVVRLQNQHRGRPPRAGPLTPATSL